MILLNGNHSNLNRDFFLKVKTQLLHKIKDKILLLSLILYEQISRERKMYQQLYLLDIKCIPNYYCIVVGGVGFLFRTPETITRKLY